MNYRPSSWLDQLVGACFSLLVGAAALYLAVRLIEAIWVVLVIVLIVASAIAGLVMWLRSRRQGW